MFTIWTELGPGNTVMMSAGYAKGMVEPMKCFDIGLAIIGSLL